MPDEAAIPATLKAAVDARVAAEAQTSIRLELQDHEKIAALRELMASSKGAIAEMEIELAQETAYRNRMFMVRDVSACGEPQDATASIDKLLHDAITEVDRIHKDLEAQRRFLERCRIKLYQLEHG